MDKSEIAVELAIIRVRRQAMKDGHVAAEADDIARQTVSENRAMIAALGTPDAIVLTIMDSYLTSTRGITKHMGRDFSGEDISRNVITSIEEIRNLFVQGRPTYPLTIRMYVQYRVELETWHVCGLTRHAAGLDWDTVEEMIDVASKRLGLKSRPTAMATQLGSRESSPWAQGQVIAPKTIPSQRLLDDHDKNIVIGEFLAKIFCLVLVWFFVSTLLGVILDALKDEHGDEQARLAATILVVWLFFQIDKWVARN